MCDALNYQRLNETKQDIELVIRKLRAACKDTGTDFKDVLKNSVFIATDRQVYINEIVED
jgi:enamine deaminase RidA (YjgF/YER057c/UK114 family)